MPRLRAFVAHENQSHSCGRHELESHFEGKSPEVVDLFWRFAELVRAYAVGCQQHLL